MRLTGERGAAPATIGPWWLKSGRAPVTDDHLATKKQINIEGVLPTAPVLVKKKTTKKKEREKNQNERTDKR